MNGNALIKLQTWIEVWVCACGFTEPSTNVGESCEYIGAKNMTKTQQEERGGDTSSNEDVAVGNGSTSDDNGQSSDDNASNLKNAINTTNITFIIFTN